MASAVEVRGVRKRYGDLDVLRDIDLTVEGGEIFGIIGPNGAGKSTLVGIIAGLRDADAGSVSVLGLDVRRDQRRLREQVGIQLQEAQLQELITVEEAMRLYAAFYRNPRPWQPLLAEWGLEHKRKDRFANLSGGQKQRLFICLSLISQPRLVILDELTTGLDPQARRESWGLVEKVRAEGATVILVTHFMEEAERLCDRIAVIDHGEIQAIGPVEDLLRTNDSTRRLTFTLDSTVDVSFLDALPTVRDISRDGPLVVVTGGDYLMADIATALREREIDPLDIAMKSGSLEDVFIRLTGTEIRE